MVYEFAKYPDETEVVFSDIKINEKGEETLFVHFERPKEYGFDSVRFELPSYKITYIEGHYSEEEIELFKKVVEQGTHLFFKYARQGGIRLK